MTSNFLLAVVGCSAALAQSSGQLGAEAWRADLKVLQGRYEATGIRIAGGIATRGQKHLYKLYPAFRRMVRDLNADAAKLSDQEMTLRVMQLIASAHVGHNFVIMPNDFGFFQRLPLQMEWYGDGLAVTEATEKYKEAIGAKVKRIGTMSPEEALAAVAPFVSYETDPALMAAAPGYLVRLAVIQQLKLANSDGHVVFTLQRPSGEEFNMMIPVEDPRQPRLTLFESVPKPLYLSKKDTFYWYQYLESSGTLYIQYNRCANDPKQAFADFVREAMAAAGKQTVARVVIDLRLNAGGNSRIIAPLRKALAARKWPVYVLVGSSTFSSAVLNAAEFRDKLHAKLVGTPPGEKPNSYGEIVYITLPHSKLRVTYSTKFYRLMKHGNPMALAVDVISPSTLKDLLTGADGVLGAAIADR